MNLWKALALVMICLLAVAVGLKFIFIEAHTFQLDDKQKNFAINSARKGLENETGSDSFNVTVPDHGSIIPTPEGNKKVVRVVFTHANTTLIALVDMDTGSVVEKIRIESSGWMTGYQIQNPRRWGNLFKK